MEEQAAVQARLGVAGVAGVPCRQQRCIRAPLQGDTGGDEDEEDEEHRYCKACRRNKPLEAFKGSDGYMKQCSACRERFRRAYYQKLEMSVDEEGRYCKACRCNKPLEAFKGSGGYMKRCTACRKYHQAYLRRRKSRKTNKDESLCTQCFKVKKKDKFKTFHGGKPSAQCKACIRKKAFRATKKNAKYRQRSMQLTEEAVAELMDKPCFYCGAPEALGIDRVDNFGNYVPDNCVASCFPCNSMKMALDPVTFVRRCEFVSAYHGGPGGYNFQCWTVTAPRSFSTLKRNARQRGHSVEITKEQWDDITKKQCAYCGQPPAWLGRHGVDRKDNSKGYTLDNCATACDACNLAKWKQTPQEFIERCKTIAARAASILAAVPRGVLTNLDMLKKRQQPQRQPQQPQPQQPQS